MFDNVLNRRGAARWHETDGWERFEFIREVRGAQPYQLTFALTGLGEVMLDDVRVVAIDSPPPDQRPNDFGRSVSGPQNPPILPVSNRR